MCVHVGSPPPVEADLNMKLKMIAAYEQSLSGNPIEQIQEQKKRLALAAMTVLIQSRQWSTYSSVLCDGYLVFNAAKMTRLVNSLLRIIQSEDKYSNLCVLHCVTNTARRKRLPGGGRKHQMPDILDKALFASMTRLTILNGGFSRAEFEDRLCAYAGVLCPHLTVWLQSSGEPEPPSNKKTLKLTSVYFSRWRKRHYMCNRSGDLVTATDPVECIERSRESLTRCTHVQPLLYMSVHPPL